MGFTNFLKAVGLGAGLFGLIGAAFGAAFYMDSDKETRENWDAPLYTTFTDSGETGKQENSSEPAVREKVYDYTAHCESCECDQPAEPDAQTVEVETDPDSPVTITQEVKVYPAKEK